MMCDDTVFQLARQLFRKAWDRADCLTYHFHTNDNMSQQLSVIGIVIVRKCGQFFCFSYVMADRRCIEQVFIQDRIGSGKVFTHFYHAQRMLQQTSGKTMMYCLRRRMSLKGLYEFFILHKVILHCLTQVIVGYLAYVGTQLLKHTVHTLIGCRHIISRVVFPLCGFSYLFNIELPIVIVADNLAEYLNKIFLIVIGYSLGIGIPYFSVQSPCFILKQQVIIRLSIPGLRGTFPLAEINAAYRLSFV